MTTTAPASTVRRRRTDDLEVSGQLFAPLYALAAVGFLLTAVIDHGSARVVTIVGGSIALVAAGIGTQVSWTRIPPPSPGACPTWR